MAKAGAGRAGGDGYHHGELRAALIEAAREVIAQSGLGALSLRDLARRVGVSSGAPFHHFPDRTALVGALAVDGFRRLKDLMQATPAETPQRRLGAMAEAYVRFSRKERGHYLAMFAPEATADAVIAEVSPHADACFGLLEDALEAMRPKLTARQRRALAVGVWSMLHGFADLGDPGPLRIKVEPKRQAELAGRLALALAEAAID
jgi:AcrR family transcriptional regulator